MSTDFFRSPVVRRVWAEVYADARLADHPARRLDGLRLLVPDAWATCHTAADAWGLPVPRTVETHVGYPPRRSRPRLAGLVPHRSADLPPTGDVVAWHGRPVETPVATFARMRCHLGLLDLVALGDAVARPGQDALALLRARAEAATGRGSRLLRVAAPLVRQRVDSPMETRVRLLLIWSGLPEPCTGWELRDADGEPLAILDMAYPQVRVAVEYDGRQHDEDPRQRRKDRSRRELLGALGWHLVSLDAQDVLVHTQASLLRVHGALRARGLPAPLPTQAWRARL